MKSPQELIKLLKMNTTMNYTHTENDGDYAYTINGNTLYLFFQQTKGSTDWKNNFKFPAKAYKDSETTLYVHSGFLKVWKSIKKEIKDLLFYAPVDEVVIVGYSHGAALAGLCHEYIWFNRPDLREGEKLQTYAFGCPRFLFGPLKKEIKERFKNFYPFRNHTDIVTHVPPVIFGYRHVGNLIKIGKEQKYSPVDSHRDYAYIEALEELSK